MAQDPDISLQYNISIALKRLLWQDEFTAELKRLKLKRLDVEREFGRDPTVLAAARQAIQLMAAEIDMDSDRLRNATPSAWPARWQPTEEEQHHLSTLVHVPAAWIALELTIASAWPDAVRIGGWLVTLSIAAISAMFALPGELWGWLQWAGEERP